MIARIAVYREILDLKLATDWKYDRPVKRSCAVRSHCLALIRIANARSGLAGCAAPPPCYRSINWPAIRPNMNMREGTMRSVRTLAAAVLSLVVASSLAFAAE